LEQSISHAHYPKANAATGILMRQWYWSNPSATPTILLTSHGLLSKLY